LKVIGKLLSFGLKAFEMKTFLILMIFVRKSEAEIEVSRNSETFQNDSFHDLELAEGCFSGPVFF
jgi:hypothetical protein